MPMLTPDQQKTELEIEKLKHEIKTLNKPWYKKTEAWLPILVGLFGTYYLVFTGFFSVKSGELEARTAKLDYENEKKEDSSILLNRKLQGLNDSLFKNKNVIDSQNAELKNSTGEKAILENQLKDLRELVENAKTELAKMEAQKKSLSVALENADRQLEQAGKTLEEEHEKREQNITDMGKTIDKLTYDSLRIWKENWEECNKINNECQDSLSKKIDQVVELQRQLAKYKNKRK